MTRRKTKKQAQGTQRGSADFPGLIEMKFPFPIRVLQTKEGELFVLVDKRGSAGPRMPQASLTKMIGPLDTKKPLGEQLKGVGPWMEGEQTTDERLRVIGNWSSRTEGAFVASVDLSDMLKNEAQVLAAIKSRDRKALETVCPNPYFVR